MDPERPLLALDEREAEQQPDRGVEAPWLTDERPQRWREGGGRAPEEVERRSRKARKSKRAAAASPFSASSRTFAIDRAHTRATVSS